MSKEANRLVTAAIDLVMTEVQLELMRQHDESLKRIQERIDRLKAKYAPEGQ